MSNMFKSDQRREDRRYRSVRNTQYNFKGPKEKKAIPIEFTESDFPELVSTHSPCYQGDSALNNLNFKDATLKEADSDENDDDYIPDGWVRYSVNSEGEVIQTGDKDCCEDISSEEFNERVIDAFNNIITQWGNYRSKYDELHGNGEYDILYGSFYTDMLHSDFEEEFYDETE